MAVIGFSQEIHLSQYHTNQQFYNVGSLGAYDGIYRLSANYRSQWGQIGEEPLVTSVIAFDHKFYYYNDVITAGLIIVNDQFSTFGMNTSKLQLSASYSKIILGNEISGGIQGGFILNQTDLKNQTFPNQWVYQNGEFDQGFNNMENGFQQSVNYGNINIGFSWSKEFGRMKPQAGFSILHINSPSNSFYDDSDEKLKSVPVFHVSLDYRLNSVLTIIPRVYYLNSNYSQNALFGAGIEKKTKHDLFHKINGGITYRSSFGRNRDAIIPVLGISYKYFDFGMSYDINVGELSQSSNRKGTIEFSLVFTSPAFEPKQMTLPCDRF